MGKIKQYIFDLLRDFFEDEIQKETLKRAVIKRPNNSIKITEISLLEASYSMSTCYMLHLDDKALQRTKERYDRALLDLLIKKAMPYITFVEYSDGHQDYKVAKLRVLEPENI